MWRDRVGHVSLDMEIARRVVLADKFSLDRNLRDRNNSEKDVVKDIVNDAVHPIIKHIIKLVKLVKDALLVQNTTPKPNGMAPSRVPKPASEQEPNMVTILLG